MKENNFVVTTINSNLRVNKYSFSGNFPDFQRIENETIKLNKFWLVIVEDKIAKKIYVNIKKNFYKVSEIYGWITFENDTIENLTEQYIDLFKEYMNPENFIIKKERETTKGIEKSFSLIYETNSHDFLIVRENIVFKNNVKFKTYTIPRKVRRVLSNDINNLIVPRIISKHMKYSFPMNIIPNLIVNW